MIPLELLKNKVETSGLAAIAYQSAPPGSAAEGDTFLVLTPGSGLWSGHNEQVAQYRGGGWVFVTPTTGATIYLVTSSSRVQYNSSAWVAFGGISVTANYVPYSTGSSLSPSEILRTAASAYTGQKTGGDANAFTLTFDKTRGANPTTYTIVQNNDALGQLIARGADGAAYQSAAAIYFEVDAAPGSGSMPGRLRFLTTADGAATPTEAMRINNKQFVGIGATDPFCGLDVEKVLSTTCGKFGASYSIYIMANYPTIGFNSYYNTAWKFGKGSSAKYGGALQFDYVNNVYTFWGSTAVGNADAALTTSVFLKIGNSVASYAAGYVNITGDTIEVGKAQATNSNTSFTLYSNTGGTEYLSLSKNAGTNTASIYSTNALNVSAAVGSIYLYGNGNVCFQGSGSKNYFFNYGSGAGSYPVKWNSGTGEITYDTSDIRTKDNFEDFCYGLKEVIVIIPKFFDQHNMIYDRNKKQHVRCGDKTATGGFVAQEVFEVAPRAVYAPENGLWNINDRVMLGIVWNAVKESYVIQQQNFGTIYGRLDDISSRGLTAVLKPSRAEDCSNVRLLTYDSSLVLSLNVRTFDCRDGSRRDIHALIPEECARTQKELAVYDNNGVATHENWRLISHLTLAELQRLARFALYLAKELNLDLSKLPTDLRKDFEPLRKATR
jgi:hypothetical protein